LYENFAEATVGKGVVDMTHVLPTGTTDYEEVAAAEERGEKEKAKGLTRKSELRSGSCSSSTVARIDRYVCALANLPFYHL
jgi:hypothetical protein